ncbi:MAG: BatA and WFA domain-containing protein [Planctomycetales bacterium]|nr:BatA and WFA domain-containing protein [Planctomycetales bacterium]
MNELFRNTLGPAAWGAMIAVPIAIFALYFLKLKRQPLEVPSTYLWTKVIEDLHVNSLWQRLRQSLLLFLQLALVALAILALLRPGWEGESLTGAKFIFLVDKSASMSSTDVEAGNRLTAAKTRVAALIDQMESDMSAMLISFADEPDVVQEFTNNKRLLREGLERIQPAASTTKIRGALELADGFANPGRITIEDAGIELDATEQEPVDLFILSDGRFGSVEGFSLGNLKAQYLPIGTFKANNLAITALSTGRNEVRPDEQQAFVQAANFSDEDQKVVIELQRDGALVDATSVTIAAGGSAGATFNLGVVESGYLKAVITPPAGFKDVLPLDNAAYAVLDPQRDSRVLLVTPGNPALEFALSTERAQRLAQVDKVGPEALATPEYRNDAQTDKYDLIIFDQCAPEEMPQANTLFIGRVPPTADWQAGASDERANVPQIIDWQRSHPLLGLVELGNVLLVDSYIVKPPPGGMSLIDAGAGPLAAIAPRDSFEDAVLGFEIVGHDDQGTTINTNWPRMTSFPNFALNVLEYLAAGGADAPTQTTRPGQPVELTLRDRRGNLTIVKPDGSKRSFEAPAHGKYVFHDADQPGVYEVRSGGEVIRRFAVNLFDRQESDVALRGRQSDAEQIPTVDSLQIGYSEVQASSLQTPVRKELWKPLLLAALAVLLAEWYIYNRRVYI